MGFFDKIKGAVNAVTGKAAKVTIEYQPQVGFPGETVQVKITAASTGGEVKSKGIFVDLLGTEEIIIKADASTAQYGVKQHIDLRKTTLEQQFQIAPEFVLPPNETKMFEGSFQIPQNLQPSYDGVYTHHKWEIRGRVEAFGNDPDTGFLPFRIGLKF